MNLPFENHTAPKRSNSGREIVYLFPQANGGPPVPSHPIPADALPHDVAQAFGSLRHYAYRDLARWLKIDRQAEVTSRNPVAMMARPTSGLNPSQHTPRLSMASSTQGSRASSVFSGAKRISVASTNTAYSHMSDPGMQAQNNWQATLPLSDGRQSLQTAHVVSMNRQNSATLVSSPIVKSTRPSIVTTPSKATPRQRENDVEAKKKYYCTACNKGFARKYDWKVHEQRYHEQQTQYPCPDCNQVLFAETLFKSHHRDAHSCQDCPHAKSVAKDVEARRKRTAWGCGFCADMLDDWEKRCDHVAAHYDNGIKREAWDHSKVIVGLLKQPDFDEEWCALLANYHGQFPKDLSLRFSKEATGRSHGEHAAQLQDLLEFGACSRDVKTIVQLAYDHGYRRTSSVVTPSHSSQPPASALMSPPFSVNQDAVMESPVNTSNQESSPTQFAPPTNNPSPMDAYDLPMNPSSAAYHTPAESRLSSVGPVVSATITDPLDWGHYSMFPDQFAMQQPQNPHRMSVTCDKPLPSIPPQVEASNGRDSVTPRPTNTQQHLAQQYMTTPGTNYDPWALAGQTMLDDGIVVPQPFFDPSQQHYI